MKKLSFVAVLGLALFLIFGVVSQPVQAESAVIKVTGMRCGNCVDRIQSELMKMDGVDKAVVDLKTSLANITFDSDVLKLNDIRTAITKIGFSADEMSAGSSGKAASDARDSNNKSALKKSCSKLKACCVNKKAKSI